MAVVWDFASLCSYSLIARNKEGLVARVFLLGLVFHGALNVVAITLEGVEGAAWARVATELLIASLLCVVAFRNRASVGTCINGADVVSANKAKSSNTLQ